MTFMRPVSHGALRFGTVFHFAAVDHAVGVRDGREQRCVGSASAEAVDITRSPDAHGGQSVRGPQILKCGNPWKFEIIGLACSAKSANEGTISTSAPEAL